MDELLRNLAPLIGVSSVGLAGLFYARRIGRQAASPNEIGIGTADPAE